MNKNVPQIQDKGQISSITTATIKVKSEMNEKC